MTALKPLSALKARDSRYCGVKAANLGALKSALPPATRVPDGFCVPFSQYEAFMRRLQVAQKIAALEQRHDFQTDANARREALAALRAEIAGAEPDAALAQSWLAQWNSQLKVRACSCAARRIRKTCPASAARACTPRCPT